MNQINADNYFCIIPEWVLYSSISSHAVRLYGTLQRYADKDSGKCHPSRKTLAEKCGLSLSSLDRALNELVDLGAVKKQQRVGSNGDFTSNIYTVISVAGVASKMTPPLVTGEGRGIVTGDEQTIVSIKQSQELNDAKSIADHWWKAYQERTGGKTPTGKGAWHALMAIINGAINAGWSPEEVQNAVLNLTVPSAQNLDRELNKGQKPVVQAEPVKEAVVHRTPLIGGADGCVSCGGAGVINEYSDDEQQWTSRKCECYTETFVY